MVVLFLVLASCGGATEEVPEPDAVPSRLWAPLPDLSGLAWVEGGAFLAVHDAKVPEEKGRPRVSIVELPPAGGAIRWVPLDVDWPSASGPSHDLESIARVPGTSTYLLAESGDSASAHQRIFVTDLARRTLTIREAAGWPVPVFDVEGTAVARLGDQLYFIFAERAHGEPSTRIAWARLTLDPLTLGRVREVEFKNPMRDSLNARPVSALDVDEEGRVWVASAYDPDRDGGPFRSAVWEVGRFGEASDGEGQLHLFEKPVRVAVLDGLKVESLAAREAGAGGELVVGTDDEDFGGVLRRLPPNEPTSGGTVTADGPNSRLRPSP